MDKGAARRTETETLVGSSCPFHFDHWHCLSTLVAQFDNTIMAVEVVDSLVESLESLAVSRPFTAGSFKYGGA